MATWQPDTCGVHPPCTIEVHPETGEPVKHLFRCSAHETAGHDHNDVATECRHIGRLVNEAVEALSSDVTDALAEFTQVNSKTRPWLVDTLKDLVPNSPASYRNQVQVTLAADRSITIVSPLATKTEATTVGKKA